MRQTPKPRTASTVRSAGHKASGGHAIFRADFADEPTHPHYQRRSLVTEFVEYPKWLHFDGEPSVVVADAAEEADVLAAREPEAPKAKAKPGPKPKAAVEPEPAPEPEPAAEPTPEQPA